MIIIGERINTSRKTIAPSVNERNRQLISDEAIHQVESGATFIDVNCGTLLELEPEALEWLVQIVQKATGNAPCSIDSPNPKAIERALKVHRGKPIVNSISAEDGRFHAILPLVREYQTGVIALTLDDEGMPETAEKRLQIAGFLIEKLTSAGVSFGDIYIDPMVRPVSTGDQYGQVVFETLRSLNQEYPGVHTICGLSNISYGLPARKIINQAFLVMALQAGLDGAILDPLDKRLISLIYASELLLKKVEYATNFIHAFREGELEV